MCAEDFSRGYKHSLKRREGHGVARERNLLECRITNVLYWVAADIAFL